MSAKGLSMASRQWLMAHEETGSLKQAFTSLVDAMRFVRRLGELEADIAESKRELGKRTGALDDLNGKISDAVATIKDTIGESHTSELTKQISSFSSIAVDQVRRKVSEESQKEIQELDAETVSERTKALKSIEAFLAVSPFPIIEKVLTLKLQDNAYEARVKYRCESNINYEFSLDTNNESFGRRFRLSSYLTEIRLPVRLAKNWLRKDPSPDFERLDHFYLVDVEVTEKNLIANFTQEEGERKARIVYSKQDTNSFLSVEYADQTGIIINVTATPDLNVHLDTETLKKSMERLWLAISELEKRKIALKELVCANVDVLDKLETAEFFRRSWQAIGPALSQAMKNYPATDIEHQFGENGIDEELVQERLKLLGSDAQEVIEILSFKNVNTA